MFSLPPSLDQLTQSEWFNHPWPSDFRKDTTGTIHINGYYIPRKSPIIDEYIIATHGKLDGFSPVAAGYVRFTQPIDPTTLPADPGASLSPEASVQLIDVDANSPEFGQRRLVTLHWQANDAVWWVSNTLAFMPTMGYPLLPATRYAFVVTDKVRALDGRIEPAPELRQVIGRDSASDNTTQALRDSWSTAITALEEAGISNRDIVHLSVFTTSDPTKETVLFAEHAKTRNPAPAVDADEWVAKSKDKKAAYDVYEGSYGPSPDYQRGEPPFWRSGGGFEVDTSGTPIVQREYFARFALAIPNADKCPMPPSGYPLVMYAHGNGGSYRSVLGSTATSLANLCMASMGVDQIMHGPRVPEDDVHPPELLFFNVQNPEAMRTHVRQSAIDEVVRARMIRESGIVVPGSVSVTGSDILIDSSSIVFYGHSQGGLNGPVFLAVDDSARGGVLSGSGSMTVITLLEKTQPVPDISVLTKRILLGLMTDEYDEINFLHPGMSLFQTAADVIDPIHYVPMLARRPRPGFAPKSIYQTEGVNPDFTGDNYTPPYGTEVQAIAIGLPWMKPVIHEISEASYSGIAPIEIPSGGLSGNLANGRASGVLAQWPASEASDGHFVVYDIPAARNQAAQFCRNLFDDPVGRVPALEVGQ